MTTHSFPTIDDGQVTLETFDGPQGEAFRRVRISAGGKQCVVAFELQIQPRVVEPDYSPERLNGTRLWYSMPAAVRQVLERDVARGMSLGLPHVPPRAHEPVRSPNVNDASSAGA